MYKLALIGLGATGAATLPPVIYAASTMGDWEKNWVVRIEDNNEVLVCGKEEKKGEEIGYRILVAADTEQPGKVKLRAEHIPGFKQKKYEIYLRIQKTDSNFMISDESEEIQESEGGGGVYCKSNMKWDKNGVKVNGENVGIESDRSAKSWGGSLNYLAQNINRVNVSKCSISLMKVVCQLQWAEPNNGIDPEAKKTQVDNSKLNISGSLPNLVYRPF